MPSDIIMVHIGTNDMYMNTSSANPTDAPANLGKLLDKLIAGMPNALIVVAKIIPLQLGGVGRRPRSTTPSRASSRRAPRRASTSSSST